METSISSHASSSLPRFAASSPRRRRFPTQLQFAGVLIGAGRHCRWPRPSVAVTKCFGGRNSQGGRDFGGELVDENMAVLRKRIHEVRMAEEGDGGPPAHWTEWEKRHHGCYTAAVCDAAAVLQRLLLNTRPSVALAVAALLAMSVPTSAIMEDVELPDLSSVISLKKEYVSLISRKLKLENFWKGSCYHLEDSAQRSNAQNRFIERYSDKNQQKNQAKREALQSYLKLITSNFPAELIQGSRFTHRDQKKLRWDGDSEEKLFEKFEKLEENTKGDEKGEKGKKDEMEDEEDDHVEEEDEESSDDGDYNQNVDFDDDEDDLNMEEEEHEDAYE